MRLLTTWSEENLVTLAEIQERISSADLETLILCNTRIDAILVDEKARREQAEDKAKNVIGICGIGGGVLGAFAGLLNWHANTLLGIGAILLFCSAVVVLTRAAYFSLKAVVPLLGNQVNEELIFDLQRYGQVEAIRYDIAVKIWVYQRMVPINNTKLFYVHAALENVVGFVVLLMLVGFSALTVKIIGEVVGFILVVILLLILFVWDPRVEKFGVSWEK
jgi:hypothetical protein